MLDREKYYQNIRNYYRESNWLYKYVWYQGKSLGIHFGFADKKTINHTEALINQYKYVIEKAKIRRGMRVFDAGCGVGGAAIYIAQNTGAKVVGITLVSEQAEEAKINAIRGGVDQLTNFLVRDYTKTGFVNESFDVVLGMESVCYSEPKSAFVKEAYRVLKPGGRLVLTDGYCRRKPQSKDENYIVAEFCRGWRLASLVGYQTMTDEMEKAGFKEIKVEDKTDDIAMSANKMRRLVGWWNWGEKLLGWLDWPVVKMARANAQGMRYWLGGLDRGLFGYFAHVAIKPGKA